MPRATPEQLAWCYIWHLLELTAKVAASHLSELAISAGYNVFPGCQPNTLNMRALILAASLFSAHSLAHSSSPHSSWQSRSRLQFSSDALPLKREYELLDGQVPLELSQSPRADITDPKGRVELTLPALQTWYNTSTGLWETTGWWNSANIMTMIGDYAEAGPQDANLQLLAKDVFAKAISCAPSKNPQPGIEDPPSNGTTPESTNSTMHESGYFKHLDPKTYEPRAVYPPRWHDHSEGVLTTNDAAANDVNCAPYSGTPDPNDWLDGFYDDDLWWALAWINAYDVTRQRSYLDLAEGIFLAVARTWGTYCSNGGIYWSYEKDYVNAIANELFFSTAAHLSTRVSERKGTYVDWAERSLDWFLASGMINGNDTINDGLTETCENNNKTVWSYNQGVIFGGLVQLQFASPSPSDAYLALAHNIATAAIAALSGSNGVIHDECEPDCGADGAQFKGVFMRNLIQLHEAAPDEKFAETIRANAESIWQNDRMSTQEGLAFFSVDWDGPFVEPANASTQSSAMDALVAAVILG